ncbi:MAG TPA: protocatechuate 3,4-dioxygenase [Hyphomicrobiaceae bacterium]|nr:protocatechuate 3,4-dioxygenase [Hyphomicrobiaceae bacterium]
MATSTQTAGAAPRNGATMLPRTSDQILGPFYPLGEPAKGGDLTRVPGRPGRAQGQIIRVTGRVLDKTGEPVRGGKLQIWQANTFGRYTHPNDDNSAPLDPCFEGFAVLDTDEDGRYDLRTVKPGAYPTPRGNIRPSHIHFEVFGKRERLITQLYFAGDPHHDTDTWLQSSPNPATIVMPVREPGPGMSQDEKLVVFDIVLMHG